ncbi:MAG: hypothetical protein A2287_06420 [Candidatus Melainabacteria bacterium RIFOXYA12_FULL_32_12]|nr:MAG: hypothetical protein A2255_06900 [Candidatus Melainabacteria bacterium RIFOXYA2_FULL_32_9]OGI31582.1 MAG: hypothetical protein A2287_06420 [Candidatus Melainabacteria bacterium RIFOXYA12_FULL_32_12]
MSYKNDHLLVIANKYGKAGGDAKAELYETWDKLRDLSVSGPSLNGSGFGPTANFMLEMARLFAPASFMPVLGGNSMNIPGTSYSSPISGGNSITAGGLSAFGMGSLGNYPGLPTGGASALPYAVGSMALPLLMGMGNTFSSLDNDFSIGGVPTGGAASTMAGGVSGLAGASQSGSMLLPAAGLIAGIGGIASSLGPYFGPFGLLAGLTGNLATGYAGSVLNAYQHVTGKVLNNADTILSMRVKNIETVVKQLDTQGDIVRKMLKESVEGDSKALQSLL